ncbi:MFS transporter [Cyanobacterium sp. IPPAS B-1200]|uniref:MFS transporter n=1 Tax=Cyanobacterium sp. IPPAS B-1200 TaxID=1562720 RepID=UPI0008527A63|nr:MFS transporter [Cyanobacterium sp. IPPAS B-1200]OEJ78882.1 MFS transporter [Cyanobacterium sp. IPPAS B-1200]
MNFLKVFQTIERQKLIDIAILFASGLLFWMSMSSLLPTLPAYIEDMGAAPKQVALVMSFFAIGLLGSRVWLGQLADESLNLCLQKSPFPKTINQFIFNLGKSIFGSLVYYPSRKVIILIGATVAAIAPICYLFFNEIPQLMAIRAFHGISIAAFTTGYSALVVDISPPKQKGELIGYMSLVIPLGMAVGPAVGGFLQEYSTYQVLFSFCAICGFLSLFLACRVREFPPERQQQIREKQKASAHNPTSQKDDNSRSFKELFLDRSFLVPALVLLLVGSLFSTIITFLPLHIRELDINFNVGLFYTGTAIASFSVRFFAGQASDVYGRGRFITVSLFCYIISMILLVSAITPSALIVAALFEGAGAGMLIPVTLALISDRCNFKERGKTFSLCVGGFDIGVALGSAVIGSIFLDFGGYPLLFAIAGFMAVIALIIFVTSANKNLSNSLKFAWGKVPDYHAIKDN